VINAFIRVAMELVVQSSALHSYGVPVIGLLVAKAYEEAGGPIVRRDARGAHEFSAIAEKLIQQ
jgi:hypothetical protein